VPPVVEPFTFAKSLHRGQRYNIMCTVTRGDLPVSIRWFKDGQPIEAVPGASYMQTTPLADEQSRSAAGQTQQQPGEQLGHGLAIKQLDPYSSTLTFASLQSRHRGVYSCEAVNEVGRANQSSALVIHGECRHPPGARFIARPNRVITTDLEARSRQPNKSNRISARERIRNLINDNFAFAYKYKK
jgi:hypothetical protein